MSKLLLYCTKAKNKYDRLVCDEHYGKPFYLYGAITENFESLNGKIVAECDYEVEELQIVYGKGWETKTIKGTENIEKLTCLSRDKLYQYCKGNGYAIHIKNLHIFDEPKKLREFTTFTDFGKPITKAPQNMCNVCDDLEHNCERYILISIRSEWLCKILNKEKTVEIRKKVLKEMLNNE